MIPDCEVESQLVVYLEVPSSWAIIDLVTKSRFNLTFATIAMYIIKGLVEKKGVPLSYIAIVTSYIAQWTMYRYTQSQLTRHFPKSRYKDLLVTTIDSIEGDEQPIVISNLVVTHDLGFVDDQGQMLVNTTWARDSYIVIRYIANLFNKCSQVSKPQALFNLAKADTWRICRVLKKGSPLLKHKDVQLHIRFTTKNVNTVKEAQHGFGQESRENNNRQGNNNLL